eukprot:11214853-Lingulodinium_polyedra.AAC.1
MGSALGTDGLPYEVYQVAPANLVCLVGRAALFAPLGVWAVRYMFGDEAELLAWKPKHGIKEVEAFPRTRMTPT